MVIHLNHTEAGMTKTTAGPLSTEDAAFVRAYATGAVTFQPDATTEPYDREGLRVAVEEIAAEHGMTVDELISAVTR
jgi:hypothetical protein